MHGSLVKNNIGDEGAKALAEALNHNSTLTRLECDEEMAMWDEDDDGSQPHARHSLYKSNIGDEGVAALAEALKHNVTLVSLGFDFTFGGTHLPLGVTRSTAMLTGCLIAFPTGSWTNWRQILCCSLL